MSSLFLNGIPSVYISTVIFIEDDGTYHIREPSAHPGPAWLARALEFTVDVLR